MKVRIEAAPGELEERSNDLVHVIEDLTGLIFRPKCHCELEKAFDPNKQIKQTKAQFEYPVIAETVRRAKRKHVSRLRKLMIAKMTDVLNEVK